MMPTVSVVVPYYCNQEGLNAVLTGLTRQDYAGPIQVVVADDGSPAAPSVGTHDGMDITVVRQADHGFRAAAARNLGAAAATGEVLAFLDGDTVPRPGYLTAVVAALQAEPGVLVVGSRTHVDVSVELPRDLGEPEWLAAAWVATEDLRHVDHTGFRYVISAVLSCRREVFETVGGFDASMAGYGGEDWEFAWRAHQAGHDLRHQPGAVAEHRGADWGARSLTEPDLARREKNAESLRLATRITHPTMRKAGVVYPVPDISVQWNPSGPPDVMDDDGTVALAVGDLLAAGDVHVTFPRTRGDDVSEQWSAAGPPALFDADPRVHRVTAPWESAEGNRVQPRFDVEVRHPCRVPPGELQAACEAIAASDELGEIVDRTGRVLFTVTPRRAKARGVTDVHRLIRSWTALAADVRLEDVFREEGTAGAQ
ncbi:glycosyltransferase [Kocuria sp. JC486]|uniref:glycosyltransferase n=1 Tax=Kocuria sp. JC486 TaxID=1970736 RepID=UPI00141F30B6|nr:glycosyltransferase [Kocuria sp. JC486]NHU85426.1 glycosyltransferase [Kocuria sp. JC486]